MRKLFSFIFSFILLLSLPLNASAHEAYVLTHSEFEKGLLKTDTHPLAPLFSPSYLHVTILITILVIISYFIVVIWSATSPAAKIDRFIKKTRPLGPFIIRIAMGSAFFYAATANSILGPEMPLSTIYGGELIRFILFVLSIMTFFGFLTEIAAFVGLLLFVYTTFFFKAYMITYANYFGEFVALFFFGSRFLSIDSYLFGKKAWNSIFEKLRDLETPIVRILYGVALMYAGWTIKFVHQSLSVEVYNQYHLINFFHASASFIAAGAGVAEILIGFFIFIGFVQRFTTIISLFFITISILYFREMLWPHFMLYGISFSIIIDSADKFTVDRYLSPFVRKTLKFDKKKKR